MVSEEVLNDMLDCSREGISSRAKLKVNLDEAFQALYSKEQLRHPKGSTQGGQWVKAEAGTGSGADRDKAKLEKAIGTISDKIRTASKEHGYVLDKKGNTILYKEGTAAAIRFSQEDLDVIKAGDPVVFIHNHPSSASFSLPDLAFAQRVGIGELRVAAENHDYAIKVPGGVWDPEGYQTYSLGRKIPFKTLVSDYDFYLRDQMWGKIRAGKKTPAEAQFEHFHILWTQLAEATGIEYSRTARQP